MIHADPNLAVRMEVYGPFTALWRRHIPRRGECHRVVPGLAPADHTLGSGGFAEATRPATAVRLPHHDVQPDVANSGQASWGAVVELKALQLQQQYHSEGGERQ